MNILAIESSCDETAAAVISDHCQILSNVVVSQIDIFAAYGGVIPEVAARSHLEAILPVVHKALDDANLTKDDIDCIAVTYAPGLLGSLLIGTLTARMLAILWQKPFYPIHHLKSHIYANWLSSQNHAPAPHSPTTSSGAQEGRNLDQALTFLDVSRGNPELRLRYNSKEAVENASLRFSEGIPAHNQASLTTAPSDNRASAPHLSTTSSGTAEASESTNSMSLCFSEGIRSYGEDKRVNPATAGVDDAAREKTIKTYLSAQTRPTSSFPSFPLLALIISGGHTQIIYMPKHNHFEIIGTTRDDAVGECFDKVAKILGLPYPGGPNIAKCAEQGDPTKYHLPHPKLDGLDFSFSGLKTAVLRAVQSDCHLPITTPSYELAHHLTSQQKADFAASFQSTACDILLEKLQLALQQYPDVHNLVFAGGVSANQTLRAKTTSYFPDNINIFFPDPVFTGDNAAMVGAAAYYEILSGIQPTDPYSLNILPRTPIK